MIRITLQNIIDFGLPLDRYDKVMKKGKYNTSREILENLEKKYGVKSYVVCQEGIKHYEIYDNAAYYYIPDEDKARWITNYEVYIRTSLRYRLFIAFHRLFKV